MRAAVRSVLLVTFGALLGHVATGTKRAEGDAPVRTAGASHGADHSRDIEVVGPNTERTVYRPHSVLVDERPAFVAAEPPLPSVPVTKFYFEGGAVKVACTELKGSR